MNTDIPALTGRLPRNPDLDELNHLAAQIEAMPEVERATFRAVMRAGLHIESMAAITNAAENLDRFDFYPGAGVNGSSARSWRRCTPTNTLIRWSACVPRLIPATGPSPSM